MRARWAQNYYKSPASPIVQQTLIANWIPWKYYMVSTFQVGTEYLSQVFRCDKVGWPNSPDNPFLECEWSNFSSFAPLR